MGEYRTPWIYIVNHGCVVPSKTLLEAQIHATLNTSDHSLTTLYCNYLHSLKLIFSSLS